MATFEQNDDSVVVVIGSGAGGGTVANELTQAGRQRGAAGGRRAPDERGLRQQRVGGVQPDGLVGPADHHRELADRPGFPEPAGLDREGGRRHHHPLVRRHAAVQRARVQPSASITGGSRAPTCWTGRSPWTTWRRTTRRPRTTSAAPTAAAERRCPPTTTTRCWRTVRSGSGTTSTPPAPTARTPNRTTAGRRRSRTGSTSRATRTSRSGAPWSGRSRWRRPPATWICGRTVTPCRSPTTPTGRADAVLYLDADGNLQRQRARVVCVAGNAIETPQVAAAVRQRAVPGRAGELLRSGRPELHAAHHRVGVRAVPARGATCTAGRRWPG